MYVTMIVFTVLAWLAGLFLDGKIMEDLLLRIVLMILDVGFCFLREIKENKKD